MSKRELQSTHADQMFFCFFLSALIQIFEKREKKDYDEDFWLVPLPCSWPSVRPAVGHSLKSPWRREQESVSQEKK